jgi:hypothetical protein
MDLLHQFAYTSFTGYAKFGILLTTLRSYGEEITFSIGTAIPLTENDESGNLLPKKWVYYQIYKVLLKYSEIYEGDEIVRVTIRVYMEQDKKQFRPKTSEEERHNNLREVLEEGLTSFGSNGSSITDITARKLRHSRRPKSIPQIKKKCNTSLSPIIVSDLETLLDENHYHKPYAAGLLMVFPGQDISHSYSKIETYFSEDYSILYPEDRDLDGICGMSENYQEALSTLSR